jgi:hypothetical protein
MTNYFAVPTWTVCDGGLIEAEPKAARFEKTMRPHLSAQ